MRETTLQWILHRIMLLIKKKFLAGKEYLASDQKQTFNQKQKFMNTSTQKR